MVASRKVARNKLHKQYVAGRFDAPEPRAESSHVGNYGTARVGPVQPGTRVSEEVGQARVKIDRESTSRKRRPMSAAAILQRNPPIAGPQGRG